MAHPAYQLDWNLIRTFTAVVTSGSLAGAARELSITYPTVARHIQQLEEGLELTLFDRTSSGMVCTPAGERLATSAQDMRSQALAFEEARAAIRTEPGGTVRITVSEFLTQLTPRLLAPLRQQATTNSSCFEIVPSNTLLNLLEHDADIALRHIRPTQADLVCRRAGSVQLSLWAHVDYLASLAPVPEPDPKSEKVVAGEDLPASLEPSDLHYIDGVSHDNLRRGAERLGVPIDESLITYKSDSVWGQLHAARAGWGVIALPDYLGQQYPELHRIEIAQPIPALELWIVARRDMRENPLHRQTYELLAEGIQQEFGDRLLHSA